MTISARTQRSLLWISIAMAVVFGIGWLMTGFIPPPSPTLDAEQVAELYVSDNLQMRIGVVLCLLSAGFNMTWSLVVGAQMARVETFSNGGLPLWAILQVLSGAFGALIFMLPLLFMGIAAFSADRAPELTRLVHEFAFLTLITPLSFFTFQAVPVGIIGLTRTGIPHSPFPRWMGYASLWMMFGAEFGVLALLFKTGPFAWNGFFPFWLPLTLYIVWFTILTRLLFRAIRDQETS